MQGNYYYYTDASLMKKKMPTFFPKVYLVH